MTFLRACWTTAWIGISMVIVEIATRAQKRGLFDIETTLRWCIFSHRMLPAELRARDTVGAEAAQKLAEVRLARALRAAQALKKAA